jgi:hypothetical protein
LLIIGVFGVFAVYLTDPGEEGLQEYLEVEDSLFGQIFFGAILDATGSENSSFYLYFVFLYFMAYLVNTFPIIGLWLGGSGIPEEVSSNMTDIFIASPHKKKSIVFRHLLTHGIVLTLLTGVLYTSVPIIYELLDISIAYDRILLAYILLWVSGATFFSISFLFSLTTLRSDIGRGVAGLIFIVSFLIQMIYNLSPILEDLKYFNILYYTNSSSILLKGEGLIFDNFLPLVIAVGLIILGIFIFLKRDPIPMQISSGWNKSREGDSTEGKSKWTLTDKIRLKDYIHILLKKVSPISAEQWKADRAIISIFFFLYLVVALSIIVGYPTGEGGIEQYAGVYTNNPFVKSIQRDHSETIQGDPLYTIYTQFYGYTWIYFFPLVVIAAVRIVDRDNDAKTIDLIHSTPKKRRSILYSRIFTILLEISIFVNMCVLIIVLGEFALDLDYKVLEQLFSIILIIFTYGAILFFLVAAGVIFPIPKYRKRMIYGISGLTIILAVLPYFNEVILPLKYCSLIYYLDLIGLISLGYQIEQLSLLLILVLVFIVSVVSIHKYSEKMEIL